MFFKLTLISFGDWILAYGTVYSTVHIFVLSVSLNFHIHCVMTSHSFPLKAQTSSVYIYRCVWMPSSVCKKMFSLIVFPSDVHWYLWNIACGVIVVEHIWYVAKFTTVTPYWQIVLCKLLVPVFCWELPSPPTSVLKAVNKIFMWHLVMSASTCCSSS